MAFFFVNHVIAICIGFFFTVSGLIVTYFKENQNLEYDKWFKAMKTPKFFSILFYVYFLLSPTPPSFIKRVTFSELKDLFVLFFALQKGVIVNVYIQ